VGGLALLLFFALLGRVPEAAGSADFAAWLVALRREALGRGISAATLDAALAGLAPLSRVLHLDRHQPESTLPIHRYLERALPARRIREGRAHAAAYRLLLSGIEARYGVEPAALVALWGMETDYGRDTGDFPVIAALATLAYDGRRAALFREELLAALRMVDEGHAAVAALRGSWAGAMGQSQFLPSSFLRYAVDHDGDGRRDIWASPPDFFASIANYLRQVGWRTGEPWGQRVQVPPDLAERIVDLSAEKPIAEWQRLGVRQADGRDLAARDDRAAILTAGGPDRLAFLIYENYRVLLRWNRSNHFALAVGHLIDALAGGEPAPRAGAERARPTPR
jgi:membrane-bound lytic murein transglycosylase B